MTRAGKRLLLGTAAFLLATFAALWLTAITLPGLAHDVRLEARRWLAAADPLEKLPSPGPAPTQPDAALCSGALQSTVSAAPDRYFPAGVLGCDERDDGFLAGWYSKYLRALGEPSLWALSRSDSEATAYRFLWLRSFHHPVSVRLTVNPDWTGVLIAKMSNGAGGYEPGTLILNKTAPVGRHGTTLLLARLLQCHYWELPTRRSPGGTDGAEWILEGVSDGRYQVVDRWSPGEADPIYALAMTLMVDLAGMRLDPKEVY